MCGIAGVVELTGRSAIEPGTIEAMADAIVHRGPDEDGFFFAPGLALANRRLSIVGLADGKQPLYNEDRSIAVVFNGELFDHPEQRAALEAKGHRFRTRCDTEVLVHLWEEYGEQMLPHLRGQFSFALYDSQQRTLLLARDRVGICPLHWAQRAGRIYFCSEIKGILASGEVRAEPDPCGINQAFLFFAMPTRRTCFKNISSLLPGSCIKIQFRGDGRPAEITERQYWDLDFPDHGEEYDPADSSQLIDEFEARLDHATSIRLRADVPVVSYLSGGVDSTTILSAATRVHGQPLPTFTIEIPTPGLNELDRALAAANIVGSQPTVVRCDGNAISAAYPHLVEAAESPVTDTSCAALLCLAREVRQQGYKVALTGEGADEALGGYPWLKVNRLVNVFDRGRFRPSNVLRMTLFKLAERKKTWESFRRYQDLIGGPQGISDLYILLSGTRKLFFSGDMLDQIGDHLPYDDLVMNLDRLRRWHPLNQALYLGYKTMLPGLLMSLKGDRPAMHNSVETRYPFLDEDFTDFCAKVHPRWKLRGLFRDKHLLRCYAARVLPKSITERPKKMFRAPFANSFLADPPDYVNQLLSEESLRKTGYFSPEQVAHYRTKYSDYRWGTGMRLIVEMGLTGVMATQLWHHLYLGGDLCQLPSWTPRRQTERATCGLGVAGAAQPCPTPPVETLA